MSEIANAVNSVRRCPECGSVNLGCGDVAGGGVNRFFAMCADCKAMSTKRSPSMKAAADADYDAVMSGKAGTWVPPPDGAKMETGDVKKPSVGLLALDGVQFPVAETRSPFRSVEEQARLENGEPIIKMFRCDGCGKNEQGSEVAGGTREDPENYYAVPGGWFLCHPSAQLFCSLLCVRDDKNKKFTTSNVTP